ncbi:molybdopterin molybdotransferase MoeA [Isoptericola sp. b490]|uniref:molybdopterin molybdotransferase MoeA n=1 Tax=Actinotalea lenta TaxID=3064654 RepID=UPI0027143D5F|nr:gephyrin-like molybdotransferase Glp [Isoptericola sp. b490]MDO8119789.1 molybdopterin molybdotransferase MoeA [Isoptericola sp. b490]
MPESPTRTVDEHLAEILELVSPPPAATLPLAACLGLTLRADLTARLPAPPFTNSSMDGFAVRAADVAGASAGRPVELPVADDQPAGPRAASVLAPGTAIRIMTGAPLPEGADAVVPVELTDQPRGSVPLPPAVRVLEPVVVGASVRHRGEGVAVGAPVMPAGTRLGAAALAAAAAVGYGELPVARRPRLAVVSTGDELAAPGEALGGGTIPDSNLTMLVALATEWGADVPVAERVGDDPDTLRAVLARAAEAADLVVTCGGISAGAYEVVRQALESPRVRFVQVAMQPGKPQGLGTLAASHGDVPVLALPGNPVSSFVGFRVLVRPALAVLAGRDPHAETATVPVRAAEAWRSPAGRRQYAPVRLEPPERPGEPFLARPTHRLGSASHLVGSLHLAHALAVVPAEVTQVEAGQAMAAIPLPPWSPELPAQVAPERR